MSYSDDLKRQIAECRAKGEYALALELCRVGVAANPDVGSQDWFGFRFNLAQLLVCRDRPFSPSELEDAIATFQEIKNGATGEYSAKQRALASLGLGSAYYARTLGLPDENHDKAIEAFSAALDYYTLASDAYMWASVQAHIALIYSEKDGGEVRANLHRAVDIYMNVLQVFTPWQYPEDWKDTCERFRAVAGKLQLASENAPAVPE
jgi:tetratricopeptide (TPR) repeat protein